jgi:hypothetical protein
MALASYLTCAQEAAQKVLAAINNPIATGGGLPDTHASINRRQNHEKTNSCANSSDTLSF